MKNRKRRLLALMVLLLAGPGVGLLDAQAVRQAVDATTIQGRVMCGYQGWFRCPGDAANHGWIHWSRDGSRLAPDTLTFEMWPDVAELAADEKYAAPGFRDDRGEAAYLFSSDDPRTVFRHFQWMRQYEIDGAWLQHFVVDLPGNRNTDRYPSRRRVLGYVADAARQTGRAWALSFDIADAPPDRIVSDIIREWKNLVDQGITGDDRYLHEKGRPVVQVWGFYRNVRHDPMTADIGNQLIDFFKTPGKYNAYLVGGGDWDWKAADTAWQQTLFRLDAYAPWNVGNFVFDDQRDKHASIAYWPDDKKAMESHGVLWMPVVYPGFGWDNLTRQAPGTSTIPRRGGAFYWEQWHELARLKPQAVYVAMFDEVDEGTAIFKVTSHPPTQAHFTGYDGLPSDWYLRLTGLGAQVLRGEVPDSPTISIRP